MSLNKVETSTDAKTPTVPGRGDLVNVRLNGDQAWQVCIVSKWHCEAAVNCLTSLTTGKTYNLCDAADVVPIPTGAKITLTRETP
jgi:hypothetical protein